MTPSCTSHVAGAWSLTLTHSSRFLPSKSTMASDGAGVGAAAAGGGVTTFGTGSHTSVSLGSPGGWAAGAADGAGAPWAGAAGVCARSADGTTLSANASTRKEFRLGMGRILVPPAGTSQPAPTSKRSSRTTGSGVPAARASTRST